ncbi:hypothetical protein EBU99_05790 [bacterium]|nr:hypothetical protein [bacterium]
MKTVASLPLFWLIACGQANQNGNLDFQTSPKVVSATQSEGGEQLGISAVAADFMGSFAAVVNSSSKKVPLNAELAFGNMVNFTDPRTQNKCSGAFAFEPDPAAPATSAIVYFYTATHCFEKVNPLGFATTGVIANQLPLTNARKYAKPYANLPLVAAAVAVSNPEVLYDGPQRTDIIRFKQSVTTIAKARSSYLPTCSSAAGIPLNRELAIGVLATDMTGLVQANSKVGLKYSSSGPQFSTPLTIANAGIGKTFLLDRVLSVPGESGGPVWLIDGDSKIDRMNTYLCLQGVLSREVTLPEIQTNGAYELKTDSYYTPPLKVSSTIRWVNVQ